MFKNLIVPCAIAGLAGALVSGGAVYFSLKTRLVSMQPETIPARTSLTPTACVPMLDETAVDDAAILERIIVWSDIASPWFSTHANADIRAEGEALRTDGAQARDVYRSLTGKEYTVPDASKKYGFAFIPKDDPFANTPDYIHQQVFMTLVAASSNEVYAPAAYSKEAKVSVFSKRFTERVAKYQEPGDVVVPGAEGAGQGTPSAQ